MVVSEDGAWPPGDSGRRRCWNLMDLRQMASLFSAPLWLMVFLKRKTVNSSIIGSWERQSQGFLQSTGSEGPWEPLLCPTLGGKQVSVSSHCRGPEAICFPQDSRQPQPKARSSCQPLPTLEMRGWHFRTRGLKH